MKKSLNYLPVQKREDLRQLTEIIREEISSCVMVILYGSYARGTYVDYDQRVEFGVPTYFMSDYDILDFQTLSAERVKQVCLIY